MSGSGRNVVLVSIDSLRADHCGFLGDERGLTPTMDELARQGISFETAIATGPQTFSSMPAVFTGRPRPRGDLQGYPGSTHWERRLAAVDEHVRTHETLPERFRELGYSTAGISPNPWTSPSSGFDRGFDHFIELDGQTSDGWLRTLAARMPGLDEDNKAVSLALDMLTGRSFFTGWETFYDDIESVRRQLSEPYFLWVFLLDTHYPFLPRRTYRHEQSLLGMYTSTIRSEKVMRGHAEAIPDRVRRSMLRSYRDTVRSVDGFIERIMSDLAADDPVFVLHSDHGESFGDHGNYGHHHRNVYEENVHVPYVVHDGLNEATVSDPVSLASVPDVALSVARGGGFDPETVTESAVVASSECGTKRTVRYRRFKYVEHDEKEWLFALDSDPEELSDVAADYPDWCADARSRLERFERQLEEETDISRAARTLATGGRL